MQKMACLWSLGMMVLIAGAWFVCPEGQCKVGTIDRAGLGLAHAWRSEPLDVLMQGVTWLGSLLALVPLALSVAGWLAWQRRWREAAFISLALLGSSILGHVTKLIVARPRPDLFPAWLPMPADWSYPSVHAMQITALAIALFLVMPHRRVVWAVLLGMLVLWVGVSRIYLQVHFPSDVIAGSLVAMSWVGGLRVVMFRPVVFHSLGPTRGQQP